MNADPTLLHAAHRVMLAAFDGPRVPTWLPDALDRGLGGICLYGANVAPGHDLADLARSVRALRSEAVLAVDEEGGDVTRLHMRTGSPYPGNAALGRYDDPRATRSVAAAIGAELAEAGIWLDLAPCLDVNSDPRNPVIGTRSFGPDPSLVARHGAAFVDGLASQGVAAAVKHFPGHGDTSTDSHVALPRVDADLALLDVRELAPFRALIEQDVPVIMTSHVLLTALDPDQPATLSPAVLTSLLRHDLGFGGVVVTDALDMAGASGTTGIGEAAVRSLRAGADLLCLGPEATEQAATLEIATRAVMDALEEGRLPPGRLLEAAARVDALSAAWSSLPARTDRPSAIELGREVGQEVARAVVLPSHTAPAADATVLRLDPGTNPAVGQTAWGRLELGPSLDLTLDDLDRSPLDGEVVLVTRRATADADLWSWIERQLLANPSALLVETGWPDPGLLDDPRVAFTYGSSPVLLEQLATYWKDRA